MNRCKSRSNALASLAAGAFLLMPPALALWSPAALAQTEPIPQTQHEATLGGRTFPVGTLRGKFRVLNSPDVELDGQADRLSPGARIRSPQHMVVMPAALTGHEPVLVNYRRDAAGLLHEVWILTPDEARAQRAGVERPLFNFWPFTSSSSQTP